MSADEMFEKLGYKNDGDYRYYNKEDNEVRFYYLSKTFEYAYFDCEAISREIDMNLLKAINKKCEELGWLDE